MTNNSIAPAPVGYHTINSFIVTKEAPKLIEFMEKVFGAQEIKEVHTLDKDDGLIIHSELKIGDSIVMVADSKEGWPFTPSLLRVYVKNADDTLKLAKKHGATIITKPTKFFGGDKLSRFKDPWNNLWWVYEHGEEQNDPEEVNEQLKYIHDTLVEAMRNLGKDQYTPKKIKKIS